MHQLHTENHALEVEPNMIVQIITPWELRNGFLSGFFKTIFETMKMPFGETNWFNIISIVRSWLFMGILLAVVILANSLINHLTGKPINYYAFEIDELEHDFLLMFAGITFLYPFILTLSFIPSTIFTYSLLVIFKGKTKVSFRQFVGNFAYCNVVFLLDIIPLYGIDIYSAARILFLYSYLRKGQYLPRVIAVILAIIYHISYNFTLLIWRHL